MGKGPRSTGMGSVDRISRDSACSPRWLGSIKAVAVIIGTAGALFDCTPHARYTRPPIETESAEELSFADAEELLLGADSIAQIAPLEHIVDTYLGIPYRYGGATDAGMDCSGFVCRVFLELWGKKLPRTSGELSRLGSSIDRSAAKPGDIVVFRRGGVGRVDHVGIYLGDGVFAHASRSSGVIRSSLDDTYHRRRFADMRRVLP